MRRTRILEKLLPSVINVLVTFILSLPFLSFSNLLTWKVSIISIFFLYNVFFLIFNNNVCLGMIVCGTTWKTKASFTNELLYIVLYTFSFSTLFIWVWFPFDIFLINMLLLQLPSILITGTTLHGYVSGNKISVTR
jgi:hypothetical protein